jgi:hypothetical protein
MPLVRDKALKKLKKLKNKRKRTIEPSEDVTNKEEMVESSTDHHEQDEHQEPAKKRKVSDNEIENENGISID